MSDQLNGWTIDEDQEGGQPNGSGEIEPSDYREWFSPERETHHRQVITLLGPWEIGPTAATVKLQEVAEASRAALKQHELYVTRELVAHAAPVEVLSFRQAVTTRRCSSCGQPMDAPGCCTSPESKADWPQGFHTTNGGCGSDG